MTVKIAVLFTVRGKNRIVKTHSKNQAEFLFCWIAVKY